MLNLGTVFFLPDRVCSHTARARTRPYNNTNIFQKNKHIQNEARLHANFEYPTHLRYQFHYNDKTREEYIENEMQKRKMKW